jgi:hypothetical protein
METSITEPTVGERDKNKPSLKMMGSSVIQKPSDEQGVHLIH